MSKKELKVLEDGMIKIYKTEYGNSVVDGRELWNGLGVRKEFATWIKNNLQSVDAIEHTDFEVLSFKENNLEGGRPTQEYILTLDIAKEICMVAGASPRANKELKAKSKEYRKYLINVEKKYKQLQQDILDRNKLIVKAVTGKTVEERMIALGEYNSKINAELEKKDNIIKIQEPKVEQHDRFLASTDSISMEECAKIYNIKDMGRNKLFKFLREIGILMSENGRKNRPYEKYKHYFQVVESVNKYTNELNYTTYVKPNGVDFIFKKLRENQYTK
ncbi:phage antirepressor KilAC domain-containing protein [Clostridium haemolyticum]|uniref:Prophage antirepressor n=1 Tax=Clostridium haemolyticum NCTC 9693 TaxID=1443114 RepID=A0ABR4TCI4_CLOHA|nr:phage antirepressor KilAC domain-containing protein [Clostridium haemolyticum]KEI14151.1 prophage antirepressor [Clostridium haemolyticum NCTC 9693]